MEGRDGDADAPSGGGGEEREKPGKQGDAGMSQHWTGVVLTKRKAKGEKELSGTHANFYTAASCVREPLAGGRESRGLHSKYIAHSKLLLVPN